MNIAFRPSPPTAPDAPEPLGSASVARIEVFDDFAAAEPAWRKLIDLGAVASPYQGYDWVRLWHHYVSPHDSMTPCLVVGFDAADEPMFLWPFVRDNFGPLRIATFFGGKHATINMALWRRDVADSFTAADMKAVLARVATHGPRSRFPAAVQSAVSLERCRQSLRFASEASLDRGQFRAAARRPERRNPGTRALAARRAAACATKKRSCRS